MIDYSLFEEMFKDEDEKTAEEKRIKLLQMLDTNELSEDMIKKIKTDFNLDDLMIRRLFYKVEQANAGKIKYNFEKVTSHCQVFVLN